MKVTMKSLFSLCVLGGVFCISAAYSAPAQSVPQRGAAPVGLGPIGPRLNGPITQQPRLDNRQQEGTSVRARAVSIAQEGRQRSLGVGLVTPVYISYSVDGARTRSVSFWAKGLEVSASFTTDQVGGFRFALDSKEASMNVVYTRGGIRLEEMNLARGTQYSASSIAPGVFAVRAQEGDKLIQGNLFSTAKGWFFEGTSGLRVERFGDLIVIQDTLGAYKTFSVDQLVTARSFAEDTTNIFAALGVSSEMSKPATSYVAFGEELGLLTSVIFGNG